MNLEVSKDLAIIAGTIIGLITLFSGLVQFFRERDQRRVEHFIDMRRRFLDTPCFQEILRLVTNDDPSLSKIPIQDRRNFGGFLEEVALMVNSRLISRQLAHYMFGHYVLLTAKSVHFWQGLDREGTYWQLFRAFARDMEQCSKSPLNPSKLRF